MILNYDFIALYGGSLGKVGVFQSILCSFCLFNVLVVNLMNVVWL